MKLDCEGCAGCCIDWRPVAPEDVDLDHERRGGFVPLDDVYNLAPLSSDEVRQFLEAGLGDSMTPRLFAAAGERTVTIGDHDIAAIDGRPTFLVGLRKSPKPVAPFGLEPTWLPTCVFLDPETLQCRIHDARTYPDTCAGYPADNLTLEVETECERVENAFDGERLLEADADETDPSIGPGSLGATVFAHPDPERIAGAVDRIVDGEPTPADRAEFVAVAAASRPGSLEVDERRYETARDRARGADSWVSEATAEWRRRREVGELPEPELAERIESERGAPTTPGWNTRERSSR